MEKCEKDNVRVDVPHTENYPVELCCAGEWAHMGNRGNPYDGLTSVLRWLCYGHATKSIPAQEVSK